MKGKMRDSHARPGLPNALLKLLAFPTTVLMELLEVLNALFRGAKLGLLPLLSLQRDDMYREIVFSATKTGAYISEKLLCSDLDGGRCPVLDPARARLVDLYT